MHACKCKFNRHACCLGATVNDMTNGRMQLLQTWLMAGCKYTVTIVLNSPLVGYKHIRHNCGSEASVTDIPASTAPQLQMGTATGLIFS